VCASIFAEKLIDDGLATLTIQCP